MRRNKIRIYFDTHHKYDLWKDFFDYCCQMGMTFRDLHIILWYLNPPMNTYNGTLVRYIKAEGLWEGRQKASKAMNKEFKWKRRWNLSDYVSVK